MIMGVGFTVIRLIPLRHKPSLHVDAAVIIYSTLNPKSLIEP